MLVFWVIKFRKTLSTNYSLQKYLTYLKKYVNIKISSLAIGSNRIPGRRGEIALGGLGLFRNLFSFSNMFSKVFYLCLVAFHLLGMLSLKTPLFAFLLKLFHTYSPQKIV